MARYIDAETLKNKILDDMAKAEREGKDLNGYTDSLFHLKTTQAADVVPKSEVEKLQEAYNDRLAKDIQTNADFVRYAQAEVALEVIEAASEFVRIYAEEAKKLADNEEYDLAKYEFRGNQIGALIILNFLAKLKKKYTEDQDDG
jgi:hypothetical protein